MLLLETIRIQNGQAQYLEYHNQRFRKSQRDLFGIHNDFDISSVITAPTQEGLYRCRILYDRDIQSIEYIAYQAKEIKKIALIQSDMEYRYKYLNRDTLDALLASSADADDILIHKDSLIRDTTIANIALEKNGKWFTPEEPLLAGTTRQRLIDSGRLIPKSIKMDEIESYDSFALMNAMIGFKVINPIWMGL